MDRLGWRSALVAMLVVALAGSIVGGGEARAEIYRWVDANGRIHFTHDLNQVPAGQRRAAEEAAAAPRGRDPIQTYSAPARVGPRRARPSRSARAGAGKPVTVRVQRAGNSMRVVARINDRVTVPFIIDTGASHVIIPRSAVDELGIDLSRARTAQYRTANGVIIAQLVTLDAVELGGARVEQVPAAVTDTMNIGLLGLSFFNRFNYNIDSARGLVTLTPNDLEESGLIRGGRSESDWRNQYRGLRARIEDVERRQKQVPSSRSRRHAELDEWRDRLEREYRTLEREADDARVPFSWRE